MFKAQQLACLHPLPHSFPDRPTNTLPLSNSLISLLVIQTLLKPAVLDSDD